LTRFELVRAVVLAGGLEGLHEFAGAVGRAGLETLGIDHVEREDGIAAGMWAGGIVFLGDRGLAGDVECPEA